MDLFEYTRKGILEREAPLASRMRPRTLDEVVGQEHIIGPDRLLSRAIRADRIGSLIFYGPPGTGKTTLAQVIANTTHARFVQINATTAGKKDMEEAVQKARDALGMEERRTILFVDEIHRFNKAQQDYLLPFVEDGTLTLIGATTENPYFEVNRALVSRSRIFELKPLGAADLEVLLRRALVDKERGLGNLNVDADDDAIAFLADISNGDARAALNALELGALTTSPGEDGRIRITLDVASECIQRRVLNYDREGDNHYDTISAFIKSMRGSDPDAAVYYLARMLYAGEDVKFIARRIMICAAEDVGNADPQALILAVAASEAVERIGMPESQIILSQAAAYVACAPKSNSACNAIFSAMDSVKNEPTGGIPPYLKDAHYSGAKDLGRGLTYRYPHDYENHYVDQQYLPDELRGRRFYEMSDNGYEKGMRLWLERIGKYPKK
ncbi:MAG: replication-associated recombination protein A [Thermoplasmata archaeon]|nr:replication-associated recombination protein A [Thermoplasmata archaeon]